MNNRGPKEKQQENHKRITIGKSNERITVEKPNRDQEKKEMRLTEDCQKTNRWPTEDQQETDRRPTRDQQRNKIKGIRNTR